MDLSQQRHTCVWTGLQVARLLSDIHAGIADTLTSGSWGDVLLPPVMVARPAADGHSPTQRPVLDLLGDGQSATGMAVSSCSLPAPFQPDDMCDVDAGVVAELVLEVRVPRLLLQLDPRILYAAAQVMGAACTERRVTYSTGTLVFGGPGMCIMLAGNVMCGGGACLELHTGRHWVPLVAGVCTCVRRL
jgi:hypothetical protein